MTILWILRPTFASHHRMYLAALLSARLPVLPGFQVSIALLLLWWCDHPNPPQFYRIRLKGTGSDVRVSSSLQGPISVFLPSSACLRARRLNLGSVTERFIVP